MCSTTRRSAAISLSNSATFVDEKDGLESKKPRAGGSTRGENTHFRIRIGAQISKLGGAIAGPKKNASPKGVIQRVTRVKQYSTRARCQLIKRKVIATSKKAARKPPCRPYYPKEDYIGGEDVNRDANCAPNVNNPSR
jgi:hypothetical protein